MHRGESIGSYQGAQREAAPRARPGRIGGLPVAHTKTAQHVLDVLLSVSPLAWPLFEAQCVRMGADASRISAGELLDLLPHVGRALARFSTRSRAEETVERLRRLTLV
ncbi:MAG: hypothetical protein WCJ30_03220 [Deltaproteobacteria bacterium]